MLDRLLVPLDGKPFAEAALPYAEALARRAGATLQLVRASLVRHAPAADGHEATIVAEERAYLARIARELGARGVAAAATVQHADPAAAIVGQARQWGADLIVMATHERGPLGRALLGSTTAAVLADTPAPVLLVGDHDAPPFAGPQRLLVPLDGSPLSEAALPIAADLAALFDAPLTLVAAVPPGDAARGAGEHPVHADLRAAAEQLERRDLDAAVEVREGDPPGVIAAVGAAAGATLIAMATRGHAGLPRLVLGGTADAVLRATDLPLLLVRPTPPARA